MKHTKPNLLADQSWSLRRQPKLPLVELEGWESLPSPKVRKPTKGTPFSWAYTYTGFSLEFAVAALGQLDAQPKTMVFDPFSGSGTTAVAASLQGANSSNVDVSPFAALMTRSRLATCIDKERLFGYLDFDEKSKLPQTENSLLASSDHAYATGVVQHIARRKRIPPHRLLSDIIHDSRHELDTEAVAVLTLALAAKESALLEKGSNPIWYKPSARGSGRRRDLRRSAQILAKEISHDLLDTPFPSKSTHRIQNVDIATLNSGPRFDICLTSPPYLNRLDYVVAHLPELSIIQLISPLDLDQLKRAMIGTTKIVTKYLQPPPQSWGVRCKDTLDRIAHHTSYASSRYYYHNHYNYFDRLYRALSVIKGKMNAGAKGIVVLQDSFYKDVLIETPMICVEMMRSLSLNSYVARTIPVRTHMGLMSPKQTEYAPGKTLSEALVYFEHLQ